MRDAIILWLDHSVFTRIKPMSRCAPGHFSIHPDDLEGREMVTTVRTATDGEFNVEFKASLHMEMSAF